MMKNLRHTWTWITCAVLALVMFVPSITYADSPSDYVTLDVEKSSLVEGADTDVFELYFDIAQDAPVNVEVDVASAVVDLAYADGSYNVMPGARILVNVHITNHSPHPFVYTDKSFELNTANSISDGPLSPFVGVDGKTIPFDHLGAIAPNMKAMRELLGVERGKNITAQQMFTIYENLAAAGYTGDDPLTQYLLDYYNNKYETEYATFEEMAFAKPQLADEFAEAGQAAGFTLPEAELQALCDAHPELEPYVVVFNTNNDGSVNFQIKWPEESIATYSYNIFYLDFFSAGFGDDIEHMKPYFGDDLLFCRDHGILDYANKDAEPYTSVNQLFNDLTVEPLSTEDTLDYNFVLTLDGPGTGNGYANYEFSFFNTIGLHVPATQYTVVHNYYSIVDNGTPVLDGSVSTTVDAHVGDVISADNLEKLYDFNDQTYEFDRASDDIVLGFDVENNTIVINYALRTETPAPEPEKPETPEEPKDPKPNDSQALPETSDPATMVALMALGGACSTFAAVRKRINH